MSIETCYISRCWYYRSVVKMYCTLIELTIKGQLFYVIETSAFDYFHPRKINYDLDFSFNKHLLQKFDNLEDSHKSDINNKKPDIATSYFLSLNSLSRWEDFNENI